MRARRSGGRKLKVITGTGRSGTSFMAQLMRELGYDVGTVSGYAIDEPPYAGMEAAETYRINEAILRELDGNGNRFADSDTIAELADRYWHKMDAVTVEFPKDPRFCYTLPVWHRVQPIEFAVVCVRDIHTALASSYAAGTHRHSYDDHGRDVVEMAARLGYLVAFLETESIPYARLSFPRMVHNANYAAMVLATWLAQPFQEIVKAHARVARPEMVHHG